jgi:hypothetical protein
MQSRLLWFMTGVNQSKLPAHKPMKDIKSIEELRVYLERLKEVVPALKRFEERKDWDFNQTHMAMLLILNATYRETALWAPVD